MTHITVRRIALCAASVSFSLLTAILLIISAVCSDPLTDIVPALQTPNPADVQSVHFPYTISCTSIVVENVCIYDGPFYEDGSGREVFQTACIRIRNTGESVIPYAHIILRTGEAGYIFDGYMIPPGASVLIPEKYALTYVPQEEYISCFGWATVMLQEERPKLLLQQTETGEVLVKNPTGTGISNITVYHRTYLPEQDLYIGGTAFVSRVAHLAAGECIQLYPDHYAPGYSKIIYYE